MSDFKAKMHLIRFRLGPRYGSLQRFPVDLAGFKGSTLKAGGEGMGNWMVGGEIRGGAYTPCPKS